MPPRKTSKPNSTFESPLFEPITSMLARPESRPVAVRFDPGVQRVSQTENVVCAKNAQLFPAGRISLTFAKIKMMSRNCPMRVLVVDDDERERTLMAQMVAALGFTAAPAGDGEEALKSHAAQPAAVILT